MYVHQELYKLYLYDSCDQYIQNTACSSLHLYLKRMRVPLHAICLVLVVVAPPALSESSAAGFDIRQIEGFKGGLRPHTAIRAVWVAARLIQPLAAGGTSPRIVFVDLYLCFTAAEWTDGIL